MAKILIVEDEEDVRTLSKQLLEILGHTVDGVGSGEQAIMRLRLRRYDFVLSDLGLPGMDGWAVAAMVKKLAPRTKVGIISGWNVQPQHKQLKARGVDFVLPKPFNLQSIEKIIQYYSA